MCNFYKPPQENIFHLISRVLYKIKNLYKQVYFEYHIL